MESAIDFEDIQGRLRGLLLIVAEYMPAYSVGLIDELISANECGVALEMLSDMALESNASIDADFVRDVGRLVDAMGLDVGNRDRLLSLVRQEPPETPHASD